jgi:hypothetical protein
MITQEQVEHRLRAHAETARAQAPLPRDFEARLLHAVVAAVRRPRPNPARQIAIAAAMVVVALLAARTIPHLRAFHQPVEGPGPTPIVTACHPPDWIPEPAKTVFALITGCPPLGPYRQLDLLITKQTGVGSKTTAAFHLPDGRYTVFVNQDPGPNNPNLPAVPLPTPGSGSFVPGPIPVGCIRSLELVDDSNHGVLAQGPATSVPLVQRELPAGTYHLVVRTQTATCNWQAQVVLNSLLYAEPAPPAWQAGTVPPMAVVVRSGQSPSFHIAQTGLYDPSWTVGGVPPYPSSLTSLCTYELGIKAADGHVVQFGTGTSTSDTRSGGPLFLGAGDWAVEMKTSCAWQLTIKPLIGPNGGGVTGF